MSVSNPFAIPIHNGTSLVNMVFFAEWVHVCFTDVVDVKKKLDKNVTSFIS